MDAATLGMLYDEAIDCFDRAKDSYNDRKYLYIFPQPDNNYWAVNYDAINCELNSFVSLFDINGKHNGQHKISEDENHQEVWFEVDAEFYQLAKYSDTFQRAIERLGVKIVFEYPFYYKTDSITDDWLAKVRAVEDLRKRCGFFDDIEEED